MQPEPGTPVDKPAELAKPTEPIELARPERQTPRPAYYPLRRRALNIRDAGHAAYHDAETPWGGVAAAFDYVRSADTRAAKAGMYHQSAEEGLIAVGRTLMALGDVYTAAMHMWRPDQ